MALPLMKVNTPEHIDLTVCTITDDLFYKKLLDTNFNEELLAIPFTDPDLAGLAAMGLRAVMNVD